MKRMNLTQRKKTKTAEGEFALSTHQLMSASHPRASIRAVLALKAEPRANGND